MRRALGFAIAAIGVLTLAVALLASSFPGERRRMADIADYGHSDKPDNRKTVMAVGAVLMAAGSAMARRR